MTKIWCLISNRQMKNLQNMTVCKKIDYNNTGEVILVDEEEIALGN